MKILFLTRSKVDSLNGRGIYLDLLNYIREKGHEVFVVTPVERREKQKTAVIKEDKLTILKIRTFNLKNTHIVEKGIGELSLEYQYLKEIKKHFSEQKFDLVLYTTPPITFSGIIKYIKNRDGAKSYLLLKDIFPQNAVDMKFLKKDGFLHRHFQKKEKELYAVSDKIGCMSEANRQYLFRHNPEIPVEKVEVNPNTIIPFPVHYKENEVQAIRSKYNLPLNKKIFIYGGNLGTPQGLDFLLETIKSLKEPDAYILVIGKGTEFPKLQKWFNNQRPNNAKLMTALPKLEYDQIVAACDVGLIFLHKDFTIPNFPSRLLSYLEMRMPVLAATDECTDMGAIIEKAKCGYWVKSGNIEEMNNNIEKLCAENLQILGDNGWELLNQEYLVEKSYSKIEKVLNV